jgi:hypothetical protein
MNASRNDHPAKTPEHDHHNEELDPTPSEVLALAFRWLRDIGPDWLRHDWDVERPKSKMTEVAMVALTILVAMAAVYSAWIFQGQLKEAQRQLRQDQRPWLFFNTDYADVVPLKDEEPIFVPIELQNIGKTPAKNVSGYLAITILKVRRRRSVGRQANSRPG